VAGLAAAVTLTAACGSASPAQSASQSNGSLFHRLVAGYVDFARCARAHGMPNLPDPQVDVQGNDHYPSLDSQGPWQWPQSVLLGCTKVWARVHAIRDQYDSAHSQGPPPASPATYERMLAIARCIRRHGFPTYPDPSASGGFAINSVPPGFVKPDISAQARAAIDACTKGAK
jgi:hypothetical protein